MFVLEQLKRYAGTDRIALVNREDRLSFAELDARSEAFAAWLLERFGRDRTPVLLYGHKEPDFLACIYGALKAGRPYVPVDFSTPPGRVGEIVADVGPAVIVDFSGALKANTIVLDTEALAEILHAPPANEAPRAAWVSGGDTAYILFTSGSTGKPKGVPITARNLSNFHEGFLPYMEEAEGGVILNQVSYSFDVSCCSLYMGLSRGMTLFTIDKEMAENPGLLLRYLKDSRLTMWVSTPSFAEICVRAEPFAAELMPFLQSFLFCGEVLTHKLCDQLAERFPNARILNTYGPTEATVLVTAAWITQEMRRDPRPIPIGYPLNGVALRIAGEQGGIVARDEECGELFILSDSVSPGYHERPDLTATRFFVDEATGKRGYRTGDICYREDGLYYYAGRTDNQLKLNGFRIELEDIESNLAKLENISRAAVLPVWEHDRVQYLAAFLLLEREDGLTGLKRTIGLKRQAAAFLPAYMIPRKMIVVDAFPLNTNGKIDKKALADRLRGTNTP